MSKLVTGGCLLAVIGLLSSMQGLTLVFGVLLLFSFLGSLIARSDAAVVTYVVVVMLTHYVALIIAAMDGKNILQRIGYVFATSVTAFALLAIPSSFVAHYGCAAGNEQAAWAMRGTPVVLITKAVTGQAMFTCTDFR